MTRLSMIAGGLKAYALAAAVVVAVAGLAGSYIFYQHSKITLLEEQNKNLVASTQILKSANESLQLALETQQKLASAMEEEKKRRDVEVATINTEFSDAVNTLPTPLAKPVKAVAKTTTPAKKATKPQTSTTQNASTAPPEKSYYEQAQENSVQRILTIWNVYCKQPTNNHNKQCLALDPIVFHPAGATTT